MSMTSYFLMLEVPLKGTQRKAVPFVAGESECPDSALLLYLTASHSHFHTLILTLSVSRVHYCRTR